MRCPLFASAFLCLSAVFLGTAHAEVFEKNYFLIASSFNDVEVSEASSSGAGVALAFGTEFHPQWYAEVGFNLAASDFEKLSVPGSLQDSELKAGIDAAGAYFSFLGKATGQSGELFYKLGVMTIGYETSTRTAGDQSCAEGQQTQYPVADGAVTQCEHDDTAIAGVIGAGFDFFVGYRSQIRFQVEHVRGDNDVQINSAQLGYRYNF